MFQASSIILFQSMNAQFPIPKIATQHFYYNHQNTEITIKFGALAISIDHREKEDCANHANIFRFLFYSSTIINIRWKIVENDDKREN